MESSQDTILSLQARPAIIHKDLSCGTSPAPIQTDGEMNSLLQSHIHDHCHCSRAQTVLQALSFQKLRRTQPVSSKIRTANNICLFKPKIAPHSPKILLFPWSHLYRWTFSERLELLLQCYGSCREIEQLPTTPQWKCKSIPLCWTRWPWQPPVASMPA